MEKILTVMSTYDPEELKYHSKMLISKHEGLHQLNVALPIDTTNLDNLIQVCLKNKHLTVVYTNHNEQGKYTAYLGTFKSDIIVELGYDGFYVYYKKLNKHFNDLVVELKKHPIIRPVPVPEIYFLMNCGHGYQLKSFQIKPKKIDFDLNYGMGFENKHKRIVSTLQEELSGIYILQGAPGTGKTTYIRKLITEVPTRKFIWIQPSEAEAIFSKDFLSIMINNKGSIFIIEDCEKLILTRSKDNNNDFISTILNFSDGIANDVFECSFVLSYNAANLDVDKALLRTGRMKFQHAFNPLSVEDAQRKIDDLKLNYKATAPMPLSDIYALKNTIV